MSSVVAAWPHYRPIISSLKVTYLWFVGFLGLFLLLVAIPALLQPVALDYELAFNAPSEEGWSVEELEAQLQEISREIVHYSGASKCRITKQTSLSCGAIRPRGAKLALIPLVPE